MDWTRGRTIGHGSTATVSLASSLRSGEVFAVKSAELSQSEFLQREQKILSSISLSPYVVGYKGCDITREHGKVMYNLFLEYVPGGTLVEEVRANGGRLGESAIRCYACQIVRGLDYLHSNGLVHCDIKGANILVGDTGAKIADFGCSKRVGNGEAGEAQIGGTPMFMAPEVARGEDQGFGSDIWAVGCTIIEMATGCPPWPKVDDPFSVIYRVGYSGDLPEFPCCLSEEARDFLDKCLRRDPRERWTASQLLQHPFLQEYYCSNPDVKQIQESKSSSSSTSVSPTSILDHGFWNSVDSVDESESLQNLVHTRSLSSAEDRIRRLSLFSAEGASWVSNDHDEDDENWITVRDSCSSSSGGGGGGGDIIISSYGSGKQDGNVGSNEEELVDSVDSRIIDSSRNCCDFFGGCKYGKDSSVVIRNLGFDRDRDVLLIPPPILLLSLQT